MKRFLLLPTLFASLFIFGKLTEKQKVFAEDLENPTEEVATDEEETKLKEELEEWLSQYADAQLIEKIISWAVDTGVLGALFCVVLKYRKYKHTTTGDLIKQFKDEIGEYLKTNFADLSATEIKAITTKINALENGLETIMKVLVLMQDNSTKGRATLIDFLGSKTDSEKVKEVAEEVKAVVDEEIKTEEEVKGKVAGDYENIF